MYYEKGSEERKKQEERYKKEGVIDFSGKGGSWKWIGGQYINFPDTTDDTKNSDLTNITSTPSDKKTSSWQEMLDEIIKKGQEKSEQMVPPVEKKAPPTMGEESTYGFINYNRLEGSRYGRLGA